MSYRVVIEANESELILQTDSESDALAKRDETQLDIDSRGYDAVVTVSKQKIRVDPYGGKFVMWVTI